MAIGFLVKKQHLETIRSQAGMLALEKETKGTSTSDVLGAGFRAHGHPC